MKHLLLYENFNKTNWDNLPFPRKFAEDVLADKVGEPKGYLKIQVFDHKDKKSAGKLISEQGGENQVTYWLKHALSMLASGVLFQDAGEHHGYEDGGSTEIGDPQHPAAWKYTVLDGASNPAYSTHAWDEVTKSIIIGADAAVNLFPFYPTKMRFGTAAPGDISTAISPDDIELNDTNARGEGNASALNFIIIDRLTHISLTTTGYSPTSPSGYYADYGSTFKNISVYQVTMPAWEASYDYDGSTINEAGLFCSASLEDTTSGTYDMPNGMLLAKRYFSAIEKTDTISISFMWSMIF